MALGRIFILFLLVGFSVSAFGLQDIQPPVSAPAGKAITRTIQGTVLDPDNQPVPQAVVMIKDSKTLQVRSYIADKNGFYHFYGLSSDSNYELRAQARGLASKEKTVSVFDSHKVIKLNLKLRTKKKKK